MVFIPLQLFSWNSLIENQETQRIWSMLSLIEKRRDGWEAAAINISSVVAQLLLENYSQGKDSYLLC